MNYTDENRGEFQYTGRARQLIRFSDMRYGNITPTDIDGYFERHGELFVFFEVKKRGEELPFGQSMALTRLVDNLWRNGKKAVLFVSVHDVNDCQQDIAAARTQVTDIYFEGRWRKASGTL